MEFAVNTFLWTSPFSTEKDLYLLQKVNDMGFSAIEIAIEDPKLIDQELLKQSLIKFDLNVNVCGAFGKNRDLTHPNKQIHLQTFDYIEQCLKIAQFIGAKYFAGPMYSATGKARQLTSSERKNEWNLAVKNLKTVSKIASDYNIGLAIEPLNRFETDLVNNSVDLYNLLNDIDCANTGAMLDTFHMNIEEHNIQEAILRIDEKINILQVSDNNRGIPGEGSINWQQVFSALKKINYQKSISIESFTTENKELAAAVCIWKQLAKSQDEFAIKGLEFLKKLLD